MSSVNQLDETLGATATSAGVFIPVNRYGDSAPRFNVSVSAVTGTAHLERSFDGGSTWVNRKDYTAITDEVLEEGEHDTQYRVTTDGASSITFHLGN